MSINLGTIGNMKAMNIGQTSIKKVYRGINEIWIREPKIEVFAYVSDTRTNDISINRFDELYASNYNLNKIELFNISGVLVRTYSTGVDSGPSAFAKSYNGDEIYCTLIKNKSVLRFRVSSGVANNLGYTGTSPFYITTDNITPYNIFVYNATSINITKMTTAGSISTISMQLYSSNWDSMIMDMNGNRYQANTTNNEIIRTSPTNIAIKFCKYGGGSTKSILDKSNGFVYFSSNASNIITRIKPNGENDSLYSTGSGAYAMALDSNGNLYVSNRTSKDISIITPSGVSRTLIKLTYDPTSIAVDSSNNIYVSYNNSNIIHKITQ